MDRYARELIVVSLVVLIPRPGELSAESFGVQVVTIRTGEDEISIVEAGQFTIGCFAAASVDLGECLSFGQLALGETVEVPTLRGRAEMKIPAGTQSGKVFRLRGEGLPVFQGRGRGDQLVRIYVEVPKKLSDRQKELLREFDSLEKESSGESSFFEKIVNHFK